MTTSPERPVLDPQDLEVLEGLTEAFAAAAVDALDRLEATTRSMRELNDELALALARTRTDREAIDAGLARL